MSRVWGPVWAGLEITGYTDNQSAMHLLRHGRSRSVHRLDIARKFASLQQQYQFLWTTEYVSTRDNVLSNCLPRWAVQVPEKSSAISLKDTKHLKYLYLINFLILLTLGNSGLLLERFD